MSKATKPLLPASIAGLKFEFQKPKANSQYPNNCPISGDGVKSATDEYKLLGFFPVYKIMRWAFDEDPSFDWKSYWEWKCDMDEDEIDVGDLVKDLDKMQRENLGDLTTGATTLLGYIGQKAIRDKDTDLAGKIYEKLVDYGKFIEDGIEDPKVFSETPIKKMDACKGKDRLANCDDSLSRVYLSIGMMTKAAVESGNIEGYPDKDLVKRKLSKKELPTEIPPSKFSEDPYKVGSEKLLRCMVESANDSLKRDQCTDMIKEVMVSAGKLYANFPVKAESATRVFEDMMEHLNQYYDFDDKNNKLNNVETWVNTTVWKADGLIDLLDLEKETNKDIPIVSDLIEKGLESQIKENVVEFATAPWITEQVLLITGNKDNYKRHDEIIKHIMGASGPDKLPRLMIWNSWLDSYLKQYDSCGLDNRDCHNTDQKKAVIALSPVINRKCLLPILKERAEGKSTIGDLEKDSILNCSKAAASIIEKSDDEHVLDEALSTYFYFGQGDGLGIYHDPVVERELKSAISKRFTPDMTLKLTGSTTMSTEKVDDKLISEYPRLKDHKGWVRNVVLASTLSGSANTPGRLYKMVDGKPTFKKYAFEHLIPEDSSKSPVTNIIFSPYETED